VAAARATTVVADREPLRPPVTVRVGLVVSSSDAGIFIAQERGYFREEGLEVEIVPFQSGQSTIPALASGQLEIGSGALNAGMVNAVGRDVPIKVVADKGSTPPGFGYQGLAVRKGLVDSGRFRGCESFRGLKVAVTALAATMEPALDRALRDCGLAISDVELTTMSYPDMGAALRGGSIDAALLNEPILTLALSEGSAVVYKRNDEFYPGQQLAVLLYAPQFASAQRAAANRFMVGYLRGVRDHYDAFARGKGKAEVIDILARGTGVSDPTLFERSVAAGINPDGYVNMRSISDDIEWWGAHGYLSVRVDATQLVDNAFVDYAIDRLGSYVPR
jgi:NitT/TauT family transport system substrate-binding protein